MEEDFLLSKENTKGSSCLKYFMFTINRSNTELLYHWVCNFFSTFVKRVKLTLIIEMQTILKVIHISIYIYIHIFRGKSLNVK